MGNLHEIRDKKAYFSKSNTLEFHAHFHNEIEVVYMLKGSADVTVDGKRYLVQKGNFIVIFPNQIHSYNKTDEDEHLLLIFSPDEIGEYKEILENKSPKIPVFSPKEKNAAGAVALFSLAFNSMRENAEALNKYMTLFFGILLEKMEFMGNQNAITKNILSYCRNNYTDDIDMKKTARDLHISVSYLSRIFSREINMSFRDYINHLRVNNAEKLIAQTDMSMTEIAHTSGFNSVRTFNRAFLKHRGITPLKLKKEVD